jgi:hypothetical protein
MVPKDSLDFQSFFNYNITMQKPKIVLSRCFSQPVRYNGGIINDDFIEKLNRNTANFM